MIVVGDTSGILSAFDLDHAESDRAYQALDEAGLTVISPMVLAEVDHVGRREFGAHRIQCILDDLACAAERGDFVFAHVEPEHVRRARGVQASYADLALDLADAVNVALAEEYETNVILTLDRRDFRTVLPLTEHTAFRVLPDDL